MTKSKTEGQEARDRERFKNFVENVRYYCEYNSKAMPDEAFILEYWKQEMPLDDIVEKYLKEHTVGAVSSFKFVRKKKGK